MLTAVIPLAHEVTAESSEEIPSREAPYPREVGTAMMGLPTSPAMTEKREASIPATAMTTSAFSISSRRERRRSTPATPTSGTRVEATPRYSRVARASSATAVSAVPPVTTATVPGSRRIGLPTESCSVPDLAS